MTDIPYIDLELACGTYRFALPSTAQIEIERICRPPSARSLPVSCADGSRSAMMRPQD